MKRGKRIFVVCHCLLNSNAKIYPLADTQGVYVNDIEPLLDEGVGLVQLPCPETCYLGLNRWGMTKEQYDHKAFRDFCQTILNPVLLQIFAYAQAGYTIAGVAGMDGSPNCGITKTCIGFRGGELCSGNEPDPARNVELVPGRGVFMEILEELLKVEGLNPPFVSLHDESSL